MAQTETILSALGAHTLPAWEELPDFELYMDQVLSLAGRYLQKLPTGEARPLTSSMVNNYVKQKLMPPPVSKRYNRVHIADLLMVCTLKTVMPISSIQTLLAPLETEEMVRQFYTHFCRMYEQTGKELTSSLQQDQSRTEQILHAALLSQAEQSAALALLEQE